MKKTIMFDDLRENRIPQVFLDAMCKVRVLLAAYELGRFNRERAALCKPRPVDPNPMMAILTTDGVIDIMSRKCCRKQFGAADWDNDFDSIALEGEDELAVIYRSCDVVAIGEDEYVAGPVVACECDENGNEASIDFHSLLSAYLFQQENTVTLNMDGADVKAFKL